MRKCAFTHEAALCQWCSISAHQLRDCTAKISIPSTHCKEDFFSFLANGIVFRSQLLIRQDLAGCSFIFFFSPLD